MMFTTRSWGAAFSKLFSYLVMLFSAASPESPSTGTPVFPASGLRIWRVFAASKALPQFLLTALHPVPKNTMIMIHPIHVVRIVPSLPFGLNRGLKLAEALNITRFRMYLSVAELSVQFLAG